MTAQRTPKTLAHGNDSAFSHPPVGQPFNFYALSTGVLILTPIMNHPALSPGARLLWGVVRNWSKQNGTCFARIMRFAGALGCSTRQIRRYRFELEDAGLLLVEERPGATWAWKLLWHPVFSDASYAEGRRKRPGVRTIVSGGADESVRTERSTFSGVLEVNTKNTGIVDNVSVVGSEKRRRLAPPDPTRSDASRRAWKTAQNRAVDEATREHAARDRRDVTSIVQFFTDTLPEELLIDHVMRELSTARVSPAQLHHELTLRAKKLAQPMRPPFVLYLAQQFALGKLKPAAPVQATGRAIPDRLITYCKWCGCEYGAGNCAVTIDGEILSADQVLAFATAQDPDFDKGGWIDCPVCVTPQVSLELPTTRDTREE